MEVASFAASLSQVKGRRVAVGLSGLVVAVAAISYYVTRTEADMPIATMLPIQQLGGSNFLMLGELELSQQFSFSFWASPTDQNPDWAAIIDFRHRGDKSFSIHQKGNDQNHYAFGIHAKEGVHGVYFRLKPATWQHVALIKSPSRMAVYVDGKIVDEKKISDAYQIKYASSLNRVGCPLLV